MDKYGSDKPDLRFELPLVDLTDVVTRARRRRRRPAAVRGQDARGHRQGLAAARRARQGAVARRPRQAGGVRQGLRRARPGARAHRRRRRLDAEPDEDDDRGPARARSTTAAGAGDGDLLFLQFGAKKLVNAVLGGLRLHVADKLGLIPAARARRLAVLLDHRLPAVRAPPTKATWSPPTTRSRRRTPTTSNAWRAIRRRCARAPTISCSTATRSRAARSGSIAPTCRRACSARSASATRTRARSSASCSRPSSTVRRPTAASPPASTAWRCSCAAPIRCAT